jgi:putative flippase GtrA
MNVVGAVSARVPALETRKSPVLAALIGVLTGGVGLAIFWSLRDLFPVEVAAGLVVLGSLAAGASPLHVAPVVAPIVGGIYGFWRAYTSNRRHSYPAPRRAGNVTR